MIDYLRESINHLPVRVSRSSKTGVSIETAPWRLKTEVMAPKAFSLTAICSGRKSLAPFATFGFLLAWLASTTDLVRGFEGV